MSNPRAIGNAREHAAERLLWARGYRTMLSKGSGQRKGLERPEGALEGDIIAIAPDYSLLPNLLVECGGRSKVVHSAFTDLIGKGMPCGFVPLVARMVKRKWRFHVNPDQAAFDDLDDALASLLD